MSIISRLFKSAPAHPAATAAKPEASAQTPAAAPHAAGDTASATAKLPFWRMARWLGTSVGEPDDHRKDAQRDAMLHVCQGCANQQPCLRWLDQKHPVGFPIFCPNAPDLLDRRDHERRTEAARQPGRPKS